MPTQAPRFRAYLLFISLISAMGGLLFGYDWVVIGGAKPFYEVFFNIEQNPSMQGWLMGSALVGCIIGVLFSGALSDKYGRKPMLIYAAVLFTVSAIGTGLVNTASWFVFYRIVGGIGIGIASNLSPLYIAEISPPDIRGKFVSINQLTIVIGILSAQIVNWLIARPVTVGENILASWNGQYAWRWMFCAEALPAAAFLVLAFIIPESPRWLAGKSKTEKATGILTRIGGESYAAQTIADIRATLHGETARPDIRLLFAGNTPKILLIGIVLAVFQQWCGINVIFNYAQEVFAAAGYDVSAILFNIVVTGVTNLVFTFVGMYTVDKLGRRPLMLIGAAGLALIYAALGACYFYQVQGIAVLLLVMSGIACFAMTLGPVVWVVLAEIFPMRIRGMAMGVATFSLWTACFLLTYTFPILNNKLGSYGTFWLYGAICVFGYLFILQKLPETKSKSLEQIESDLTKTP